MTAGKMREMTPLEHHGSHCSHLINVGTPSEVHVPVLDGRSEDVLLDKITSRIKKLCYGLNMDHIDPVASYLEKLNSLDMCI